MAGNERLSDIADISAIEAQINKVIGYLDTVDNKIKNVSKLTIAYNSNGSTSQFAKDTENLNKANQDLIATQKNLMEQVQKLNNMQAMFNNTIEQNTQNLVRLKTTMDSHKKDFAENLKLYKDGIITKQEYNKRVYETTKRVNELKLQTSELSSVLKTQQKEQMALTGSMDEMSQRLNLMKNAYRSLSEEQRNSATGKEMLGQIQILDNQVKELDATIGNHQRNVGNYSSTLIGWANTLRGLRGPTKLFGEALGLGAQQADMLRLVIEHGLQGLAAYFKGKKAATAATEEGTVAEAAQAEAHVATTTAMTAETAVTEGATAATNMFSKSLLMALVPIVAIIGAVGIIIALVADWINKEERLAEAALKVAEAQSKIIDDAKQDFEDQKKYNEIRLQAKKDELAALEASGASRDLIIAKEKELAELQRKNAGYMVGFFGGTKKEAEEAATAYEKLKVKVENLDKQLLAAQENNAKAEGKLWGTRFLYTVGTERLTKERELAAKQMENAKKEADMKIEIYNEKNRTDSELTQKELEEQKIHEDDIRKAALKRAETRMNDIKAANQLIINSEKTGLQQKLAAMESNDRAEKDYINKQQNSIRTDKSNLTSKGTLNNTALAEIAALESQKNNITKSGLEERRKLIEQDFQKRYELEVQTINTRLQANMDMNKDILSDDRSTYEQKLDALGKNGLYETAIELNNYELRKSKIKRTDAEGKKELEALEAEHQRNLTAIAMKGETDRAKLALDNANSEARKGKVIVDTKAINAEIVEMARLNGLYEAGKISVEKYNIQKQKVADQVTLSTLRQEENLLNAQRDAYIRLGKDYAEIDLAIAQNRKKQQDVMFEAFKRTNEKEKADFKKKFDDIANYAEAAAKIVGEAMEGKFTAQKNHVQDVEDAQQRSYENEVKNIEKSSLSEQDKTNKLLIAEKQRQAQKTANEREQRRIDQEKARFQKEFAIFSIIVDTAKAIVADLATPWKIPIDAALGAAQLAVVASAPLPKYYTGTESAKGGLAMTDEKGAELYIEPSGHTYLGNDKPTLRMLKSGTKIIPADKVNDYIMSNMLVNSRGTLETNSTGKKIDELKDMVAWQTNKLSEAYQDRKAPIVNIINQGNWNDYLERQVKN